MTAAIATRRLRALAAVAAMALGVTACGDAGPHAVTTAESERLADMLYDLWDGGGMAFELTAQPAPGQTTHLVGEMDYATGIGYATVTATGADAPVEAVFFNDTVVLEHIPSLADASGALAVEPFTWVSRPLDSTAYDLDGLLALVAGMATQRRDNPELIRQSGAQWLREAELRGVTVDVFEYSEQARFWVEQGTARLVRFEGNNETLTRPIVIDILEIGPVQAPDVAPEQILDYEALGEFYAIYRTPASA